MMRADDGLARSVQVRLVRHAAAIGVDPNLVLTRYAAERLLYRLSVSVHADRFVLKGALLLLAWLGETLRPTRDVDLLGFGDLEDDEVVRILRDVCATIVEPDAVVFDPETIALEPIRAEDAYGGRRATLTARLAAARLRVQVDIGIGDAVTPAPQWLDYPGLLDLPRPRLRAYPRESVIAEKLHAIVLLGMRNSRMKDYFDMWKLVEEGALDPERLAGAIAATFARRATQIPNALPTGLSRAFWTDAEKQRQWSAFAARNRLEVPELGMVSQRLADFLAEPIAAAFTQKVQQ
jgi:predicted nucleotidyltransferase component of viral defense system